MSAALNVPGQFIPALPEVNEIDEWIVRYDDKKMLEMGISARAAHDAVQKAIHGRERLSNVVLQSADGKEIRLSDLAEIKDFLSHGRRFQRWSADINGRWREQPWLNFASRWKPKAKVIDAAASASHHDAKAEAAEKALPKAPGAVPEPPLQFGPVIDRVVNALGAGRGGKGVPPETTPAATKDSPEHPAPQIGIGRTASQAAQ